ncbi:hypothetical protein EDD16DRAFT_1612896 [Pisolithus croceorrhizus]|nr:hypothetical protein EDD16DRAFT_1612896 [Pisolithus croceorrhizus]KAI6160167.1 hypothetical protein EDD17DRAFT_839233 [Pisolithus thermaeus]
MFAYCTSPRMHRTFDRHLVFIYSRLLFLSGLGNVVFYYGISIVKSLSLSKLISWKQAALWHCPLSLSSVRICAIMLTYLIRFGTPEHMVSCV